MAFFITKNGDANTILMDGGSVKIGDNLEVRNGYLNALGGDGGASTLNELDDVTIQSPQNGQYLSYNSSTGMWENVTGGGGGSDFDVSRIKAGEYITLTYLDQNEQEVQSPQDAYYVKINANIPAMEETISQWERVVANALARHEQAIQELQNA